MYTPQTRKPFPLVTLFPEAILVMHAFVTQECRFLPVLLRISSSTFSQGAPGSSPAPPGVPTAVSISTFPCSLHTASLSYSSAVSIPRSSLFSQKKCTFHISDSRLLKPLPGTQSSHQCVHGSI